MSEPVQMVNVTVDFGKATAFLDKIMTDPNELGEESVGQVLGTLALGLFLLAAGMVREGEDVDEEKAAELIPFAVEKLVQTATMLALPQPPSVN